MDCESHFYFLKDVLTYRKYETQEKMEHFVVDNVRSALETGKLKSPVPEQKDMPLKD